MKNTILRLNLLPEEFKEEFDFAQKIKKTSRYMRMILGLLGLFSLFLLFNLIYLQRLEGTFSEELASIYNDPGTIVIERAKADIKAFNNELHALAISSHPFSWPTFLIHLATITPPHITFERLAVQQNSSGTTITLDGKASKRQDLINLENALRSSPYVSEVRSPLANYRKTQDVTFQVVIVPKNSPETQ